MSLLVALGLAPGCTGKDPGVGPCLDRPRVDDDDDQVGPCLKVAPDPAKLIADFAPTGEIYTLAAKVTGPISSAFPDATSGLTMGKEK